MGEANSTENAACAGVRMRGEARARVREVAWVFLKLGTIAFGGPAAHVAMMEGEVVGRRGWVSREEFLDLWSATNFIPGPNSTEMAIHLGYRRAGWAGQVVGGVCFIVPAAMIVTACAWAYVEYGELPRLRVVFACVAPVIVAVVGQAIWNLGKTALVGAGKGWMLWCVAGAAVVASAMHVHELIVLGAAGVVMGVAAGARGRGRASSAAASAGVPVSPLVLGAAGTTAAIGAVPSTSAVFWIFAKIGSVLFGSGYVLLAFLQAELVERRGWLTQRQMIDAVAVGQFTPGPVFTTATFIGYLLRGLPGAGAATAGIFAPAFVFVAITAPFLPLLRKSRMLAGALDGVNAASLALMAVVAVELGRVSLGTWWAWVMCLGAMGLLVVWRVNSAWVVCGAVVVGVVMAGVG